MNLPDITLLFQIIHFGIGYCFLKRYVFIPAYDLLECQKMAMLVEHEKTIAAQQLKIDLQNQKVLKFRFIQQSLYNQMPDMDISFKTSCVDLEVEKIQKEDLSVQQKIIMVQSIKQAVKKV